MKNLCLFITVFVMATTSFAQDNATYFLFELMDVEEGMDGPYLETEEFWSEIHQSRIDAGEIIGWDLWQLEPGGTDQGYRYMTVTIFSDYASLMSGLTEESFREHMAEAYPDLTDDEAAEWGDKTIESRDLAVRIYLVGINGTEDDHQVKVGSIATMAWMKVEDDNDPSHYEAMEDQIFKPMHQEMVDEGELASWWLGKFIFPAGSDRYASHVAVNFYEDMEQFTSQQYPDISTAEDMGMSAGLESRDMRSVSFARALMVVR